MKAAGSWLLSETLQAGLPPAGWLPAYLCCWTGKDGEQLQQACLFEEEGWLMVPGKKRREACRLMGSLLQASERVGMGGLQLMEGLW